MEVKCLQLGGFVGTATVMAVRLSSAAGGMRLMNRRIAIANAHVIAACTAASTSLFVAAVPPGWSKSTLREFMSRFGEVADALAILYDGELDYHPEYRYRTQPARECIRSG